MSNAPFDHQAIRSVVGEYRDPKQSIEQRSKIYRELLGYVPPRIQSRFAITGAIDPKILDMQEEIRAHAMYPKCFDVKTAQLILFAVLLMDLSDAARIHATAARRAGASFEELQAVINLVFLFRGLPAANRGAEILVALAESEHQVKSGQKG
jgi:alkylhydroperoxidase/carboxymuconolactone decarboxylase family protein YurZ